MKEAQIQFEKIKMKLILDSQTTFYTTILLLLKHKWTTTIPTLAIDGYTLIMNPEFFKSLSEPEQLFGIIHEINHVALNHITRGRGKQLAIYNMAADYVINLMLVNAGYMMIQGGLLDRQYADMSTDQVYDILFKNKPDTSTYNTDITIPEKDNPQQIQQTESHIKNIINKALLQTKSTKDLPNVLQRAIQHVTNPKLPWNIILQNYMNKYAQDNYSTYRFNKHYLPTFYLPTLYAPSLSHIVCAIDASGSVTSKEFSSFILEITKIQQLFKPTKLKLITFNTRIINNIDITHNTNLMKDIKFTGYGGTRLYDLFDWINKNKPEVTIVFSDGEFDIPPKPNTDIIYIIHNNKNFKCDYGKVIHYTMR